MCFSASGSFIASAGLALAGGATAKKAKKNKRFLATIPLMFAIQQAVEGAQWLVAKPSLLSLVLGYAFLFFAFIVWPVFIPWVALRLEEEKSVRDILKGFIAGGSVVSTMLLSSLIIQPLTIEVANHSILYNISFPHLMIVGMVYVFVVCGSLLVSSDRRVKIMGLLVFAAAALAWLWFQTTFVSVWCLFAAILSGLVYSYIRK